MTKSGKITIASIISAIIFVFGILTVLAGLKIVRSQFFETVFIYSKYALLTIIEIISYLSQRFWALATSNWVVFTFFVVIFGIFVIRWLFSYHSE